MLSKNAELEYGVAASKNPEQERINLASLVEDTRAIRQLPGLSATPILAMTANAFDEDRSSCLAAGMDDHIGKPVDPDPLYATLLHWLQKSANTAPQ